MRRVRIDKSKCHGHNRCAALAPEVFDVDDDGLARVVANPVPENHEQRVRRAALACPERAITLDEEN